jgi:hypothetical protein
MTTRTKKFLILWIGFHLFALVTSKSKIYWLSNRAPRTEAFWPLTVFKTEYKEHPVLEGNAITIYKDKKIVFTGLFEDYDYSEFGIYVGLAFLVILFKSVSNNNNSKEKI